MVTVDDQHGYDEAVVHAAAEANWQAMPPQALLTTLARLRAFAILLCMNADLAEHLVAITLLCAGVVMKPSSIGLNLAAWLLGRLRQYYYREHATGPDIGCVATLRHLEITPRPASRHACGTRRVDGRATRGAGPGRGRRLLRT